MQNSTNKKNGQSGRSMIEMLGVLAIVGVLSAGGIAGYSMAMQSHKTNQLIERIQLISSRIRTTYKNGDYTDLTPDNLFNSGKISVSDLQSPFGGTLEIGKSAWTGGNYFYIGINGLPAETCTDILQTHWGDKGVFEGVGVKGTTQLRYTNEKYPISTSDVITYCQSGEVRVTLAFK